ncbi:MAG TPA: hypothetical protein VK475_04405, partial [Pyrinomonadaceae bacterium]|nr:hypothetical protein [Pyrinomonadaceae bacterium]
NDPIRGASRRSGSNPRHQHSSPLRLTEVPTHRRTNAGSLVMPTDEISFSRRGSARYRRGFTSDEALDTGFRECTARRG